MKHVRIRGRTALLVAAVALVWGAGWALAGDDATSQKDEHGAAVVAVQQSHLDKLLGQGELRATPLGVDPRAWADSIPEGNELTPERVALGRKLYFDKRLSKDESVSCATCHDVLRGFTDQRAVSEGVGGQHGKRNAPTVLNTALLQTVFLDGRSPNVEHQAGMPILNPVEMSMPDEASVVKRLKAIPEYPPLFQKAYGRVLEYEDIGKAIGAFERTLMFTRSHFMKYLLGDEKAVSQEVKQGWALFNGKARCAACHAINASNPLGTDNRFHNIGVSARKQDFEKLAKEALTTLAADPSEQKLDELAVGTDLSELGRFMVTHDYVDIGAFRTSQLLNVGVTAPYMHDGSLATLWDVMDHYNRGGEDNPYLDGGIEALALSEQEIDQVVAFLFSLTDERLADQNHAEFARQRELSRKQRPLRDEALAERKVVGFERRVMENK